MSRPWHNSSGAGGRGAAGLLRFARVSQAEQQTSSGKSRIIWTFADQALSSLTNFALSIVVAKSVSAGDYGAFSLMLVTFSFLIGLSRSAIGDPFVIRFTGADPRARLSATRQATGAAISLGVLAGVLLIVVSFTLDDASGPPLLALGLAMPGLMLQETWRHIFFSAGRPRAATINDGIWTVIQFTLLAVLLTSDEPSVFLITLAWGFAALVAGLIGIAQTGAVPRPQEAMAWYHRTRDINVKMGLDFAFNQGASTLATYAVAWIVGAVAVGAIRAAQTLLGPLNLLAAGVSAFALPVFSKAAMAGRSLLRESLATSGLVGASCGIWVLILLVIPNSVGVEILGDSWDTARQVMLPMGIVSVTVGFVMGASLGLKALRRADQMLRVTFIQAPLMLGLGAVMGALWGGPGAAWGFAIAQLTGSTVCWAIFLRADRLPRPWAVPDPTGAQ